MKGIYVGALICAATALPACAAVSGYWDSSKVLHAILGNGQVADALRQQPVQTITRIERGYRLSSQACTVDVTVTRTLPNRPGPTTFALSVGPGQCDETPAE